MAIDLKKIDGKKAMIIVIAILAGAVAVALTGKYIETEVSKRANPEVFDQIAQRLQVLDQNTQFLNERQQAVAQQLESRINALSQEMKAAPSRVSAVDVPAAVRSLAYATPLGKRAITLRINTLSAVGGLLNPGDFVDILAHLNIPSDRAGASAQNTTVTLFQNVQILALGPNINQPADFADQQKTANLIITFAVDPREAELLTFAEKNGLLQLVLRGPEEKDIYRIGPTDWAAFGDYLKNSRGIEIYAPEIKRPEKPTSTGTPSSIQIIRGGQPGK